MALTRVTSGGIAPGVEIKFDQNNTPTTPAISFEGDIDTGIYSPTADTIAIATGGVKRFQIGPTGELTVGDGTGTNPVYLPVTDSQGSGGAANGKTLYVNCNSSLADDSIENNGENLNRPFKTIERALIQAARVSYVVGTGNQAGSAGADLFEYTSVIVYPGQYEIDNRPGEFLGSLNTINPADSYAGDYSTILTSGSLSVSDFYKFNALDGGIIVPRGTSIVGLDLRKTVIRPKYIPDAVTGTEGAIFRLTGGCYLWQLTIKDGVGQPYYNKSQQYSNGERSHHKLVAFKFATVGDLASYYRKVDQVDPAIPQSGSSAYELFQRVEENRIVGDSTNASTIDSVSSASPYVFNCSLRSTWGMSGMNADGADATGFRSMVVAQFTGISLQKDDRAFYLNGTSTTSITAPDNRHRDPASQYIKSWRHFHIKADNSAFIQIVSVFAVGYADHFVANNGGDLSITNSNSNFGNTSLRSIGFQDAVFPQNNKGKITAIIPPKGVDPTNTENINDVSIGFVNTQKTLGVTSAGQTTGSGLNKDNSNFKVIYLGTPIKRRELTEIRINEGTDASPNFKRYLVLGNSFQYTLGKKVSNLIGVERIYLDIPNDNVSNLMQEPVRLTASSNDPSYNQYGNDERVGYGWDPSTTGTVDDETEGFLYVKLTYAPTSTSFAAGDKGLLNPTDGVFSTSEFTTQTAVTNPDSGQEVILETVTTETYDYFFGLTKQPYITRLDDSRGVGGGKDLLWRLEYRIDKAEVNAKAPERRFILYPHNYSTGQSGFNKVLYVYEVEIAQDYKYNVQDGVYYLTVIKGDVDDLTAVVNGSNTSDYPVSQNINYLYPTINQDDPVWNPIASTSKVLVDGSGPNARSRDIATSYIDITDTVTYPYTTPDLYSITREALGDFISSFPSLGLPSGVSLATPYGTDTTANSNGKELDEQGRKIALTNPQYVSLKRSSIIRASSHTWEYLGFGPGNYSTAFPSTQTKVPDRYDTINAQGIEHAGGFTASTGTNSQGEFYIGNQVIRAGTDETETLNVPKVKYSSETRLIDYNDISNQLTNSLITNTAILLQEQFGSQLSNVQTLLQSQISGLANNFVSKQITASQSLYSPSSTTISGELNVDIPGMSNTGTYDFPTATTDGYGFATKADDVADTSNSEGFITPSDLEQWRISKGIQTTSGSATQLNYIFIQPSTSTSLSSNIGAGDTVISVASTDGFENSGVIELEYADPNDSTLVISECIRYTGKTASTFTGCQRGYTDPRTGSATTPASHSQGSVVVYAERYWWTEPYQTLGSSTVQYKPARKIDAYTSGDIDYYINNNFTPNPENAKNYGVKLQAVSGGAIGTAVKQFKPFSTLSQAAAWASKNGFGANDTIYLRMKPGYYFVEGGFTPRVVIQGATLGNSATGGFNNIGDFTGNDGVDNHSVFFYRSFGTGFDYAPYDNGNSVYGYGTINLENGGLISNVHFLNPDETVRREGIASYTLGMISSARSYVKSQNPAVGSAFVSILQKLNQDRRDYYLANHSATVAVEIAASGTGAAYITGANVGFIPASGSLKIDSEVINYTVTDYNDAQGIKINITSRGVDGTSAALHTVGTNVYYYYVNNYVTAGNKFRLSSVSGFGRTLQSFGGTLHLDNITFCAQNNGRFGNINAGGVYQGGSIYCKDTAVYTTGLRLRGNERWIFSDAFSTSGFNSIGHSIILFDMDGKCSWAAGSGATTSTSLPQTDTFYKNYPTYNYAVHFSCNHLESTTDASGNVHTLDSRMHYCTTSGAISGTASTITITANGKKWPSSGSAILGYIEEITYTGKTDNGDNTYTLTGVTRNTNAWLGSNGTGGAWYSGTPIIYSAINKLADYTGNTWTGTEDGTESGSTDDNNWKFRGPKITYFMGNRAGFELRQGQYSVWRAWGGYATAGWFGRMSTMTTGGESNSFINYTTQFDWYPENQYYASYWKVAGIGQGALPGFPSVTISSAIDATTTSIPLAGSYERIRGGTIQIGNELMYITGGAGTATLTVTRGHLRTTATSHSSGAGVGVAGGGSGALTTYRFDNMGMNVSTIASGTDFQANTKSSAGGRTI